MAIFEYTALNQEGRKAKGLIDAVTLREAREKIRNLDLFPVEVFPGSETVKRRRVRGKIKKEEIALLTRQLSSLLRSGIPLVEALETIAQQEKGRAPESIFLDIASSIREGSNFHTSLLKYPHIFSPLYINMVKVAEETGELGKVLSYLSSLLLRGISFKNRIKNAFTYPLFVLIVGTGVLTFLLWRVIPSLSKLFAQFNYPLPFLTRMIISFSQWLVKEGIWIILSIVFLVILISFLHRKFREKFDEWKIKIPILGRIFLRIIIANFSYTLSSLLKGGVPLLQALYLSYPILGNKKMEGIIKESGEKIKKGESFSKTLVSNPFFPPLFVNMIKMGEKSGNLGEMFEETSHVYEEETDILLSRFSVLLEPIVIIAVGVVVGVIVISVLLPIFEMNQILMGK